MTHWKVVAIFVFACVLATGRVYSDRGYDRSVYQHAIAQSDHLITANRIGPIRLGMYMDEVATILGQPQTSKTCDTLRCIGNPATSSGEPFNFVGKHHYPQYEITIWTYDNRNFAVQFSKGPVPSVIAMSVRDQSFVTEKGLRVGMSTFDAARIYGTEELAGICLGSGARLMVVRLKGSYEILELGLSSSDSPDCK